MATNNKYDRQLRLWGAQGQKALGETTVVLLRASACGTETLKNLVLPGIGSILVVDDQYLTDQNEEHKSNFFLVAQTGGGEDSPQPRAKIAMELLQELNPDVKCKWKHVDNVGSSLEYIESIGGKVLVVASDIEPDRLIGISAFCANRAIPLVSVHSYGLIGSVRNQFPPLPIMDPKPGNRKPDLRLVTPFPKFVEFCDSIDLDRLENHEHAHVPYPVLLYKFGQMWKADHEGKLPSSFAEKGQFRELVKSKSREYDRELNFQEACDSAYLAYTENELDLETLKALPPTSGDFARLLEALQKLNRAPLNGTIPDMTASTELYVKLQQLYHYQAAQDLNDLKECLGDSAGGIEPLTIETFCKNVFHLDCLTTRTIQDELEGKPSDEICDDLGMATFDPYEVNHHTPLLWYFALKACHLFYHEHGKYPGLTEKYLEDVDLLQACIQKVCREYNLQENDLVQSALLSSKDFATEMARYGNAEVHNVASVLGGVASQEAVKIITGQYVPFNNTYVYNGIASVGGVYSV